MGARERIEKEKNDARKIQARFFVRQDSSISDKTRWRATDANKLSLTGLSLFEVSLRFEMVVTVRCKDSHNSCPAFSESYPSLN